MIPSGQAFESDGAAVVVAHQVKRYAPVHEPIAGGFGGSACQLVVEGVNAVVGIGLESLESQGRIGRPKALRMEESKDDGLRAIT